MSRHLLVNGQTLHFGQFEMPTEPAAAVEESHNLASWAYVRSPGLSPADAMNRTDQWLRILELPQGMPQSRMASSLWDLIHWNEESLMEDFAQFHGATVPHTAGPFHLINAEDVRLGAGVKLEPGCVLDASRGPVVIGEHAVLGANSVIQGPCFIGPYCQMRPLTVIHPGVSAGAFCRLGGEISASILFGFTNKSHEGFLGHSYLGKWCNLGAGTNTSNIKNTYSEVTVKIGSREIPTGRRKLGTVMGDHTKTAIGTRLMTGSYLGFSCQLAGSAIPPRFMSSFTFWTDRGPEPYRLEKAIEVIQQVYARRDRTWTSADEQILRYVAEIAPQVER